MKKPKIVKKIGDLVVVGIIGITIATAGIKTADYIITDTNWRSSSTRIVRTLDVDDSYINTALGSYAGMHHNNGEPIYVYRDNLTYIENECCERAFDEVFGHLGSINPNYKYEFVDEAEYKTKKTKYRIKVENGIESNSDTVMGEAHSNEVGGLVSKMLFGEYKIRLNNYYTLENTDRQDLIITLKHEILHLLGLSDVYNLDENNAKTRLQRNTMLETKFGNYYGLLTPNDVKCLYAIYHNLDKTNTEQDLLNIKAQVDEYTKGYYNKLIKKYLEKRSLTREGGHFTSTTFEVSGRVTTRDAQGENVDYYRYTISLTGDKYLFTIFDGEGTVLDMASGEARLVQGCVIMRDVKLKHGIMPLNDSSRANWYADGLVADFVLTVNKDGIVRMDDFVENDNPYYVLSTPLEEVTDFAAKLSV